MFACTASKIPYVIPALLSRYLECPLPHMTYMRCGVDWQDIRNLVKDLLESRGVNSEDIEHMIPTAIVRNGLGATDTCAILPFLVVLQGTLTPHLQAPVVM